ncbi:hypothetical protein [Tenacibaculum piscium]|uniref:hypothetical protein n=1 Tax=Tenacibaculum piscium TaxID=1458515 RepID=UPI001F34A8B6|nr:hypothetical protein [Tenacibaculum piscium]
MAQDNNIENAMLHFGNLNEEERALFLKVVAPTTTPTPTAKKKRFVKPLPVNLTEEYFYNDLVENHNEKVRNRLAKAKYK